MRGTASQKDNDKVDLTEKLTFEMSSNKDLLEKLQKTELQLQRLTDAIEIKDRELSLLRESSSQLNKQVLQHEQLADRLRHYEANDNVSHTLQNELQEAKQTIVRLTNEINLIKNQETGYVEDAVLLKQIKELKLKNEELEIKLQNDDNVDNQSLSGTDGTFHKDVEERVLEKEEAMKRLEEKVKRTMQDIADLSEEKQRLEHLVLQLQGETETIGEYVALYQHQRMILKLKAVEKDEQLQQLAVDREHIKAKLEKLNRLVEKLLHNKQIGSELLNQLESSAQNDIEITDESDESSDLNVKNQHLETADEILSLLSEIKTSNLVEPKDSIHHCPYCSGQLITV